MFKRLIPTWYSKSIYEIDLEKLKEINIKYILSDLDNTIVSFHTEYPTDKANELINTIKENNMELIIISNNNKKRLNKFCYSNSLRYLCSAKKPFSFKLKKYLNERAINPNNCVLVGDQLLTDVLCSKGAKIASILVEPLEKKESKLTFINRKIDKRIRKRFKEKNLLKSIMKEEL